MEALERHLASRPKKIRHRSEPEDMERDKNGFVHGYMEAAGLRGLARVIYESVKNCHVASRMLSPLNDADIRSFAVHLYFGG